MNRKILCLVLANLLAAQSVLALPTSDHLGDSFSNLQKFARQVEAVHEDAQIEREKKDPPPSEPEGLDAQLEQIKDVRVTDNQAITLRDSSHELHGYIEKAREPLRAELSAIINAMALRREIGKLEIVIIDSPFPYVDYFGAHHARLEISLGAFAFAENKDELAALIAQAFTRYAPTVYLVKDDPRILRRLNDQLNFDALSPEVRDRLKGDISVMERLRGANLRPWGLTDFELRTFTYFREVFHRSALMRKGQSDAERDKGSGFYLDPLFETRILTQKIVASYMQERENLRDLIAKTSPFDPETERLHWRARRVGKQNFRVFGKTRKWMRRMSIPTLILADATGLLPAVAGGMSALVDESAQKIGMADTALYQSARGAVQLSADLVQSIVKPTVNGIDWAALEVYRGFQMGLDLVIPILKQILFSVGSVAGSLLSFFLSIGVFVFTHILGPVLNLGFEVLYLAASNIWALISMVAHLVHDDVLTPIYQNVWLPIYDHSDARVVTSLLAVATGAAIYKYAPDSVRDYWAGVGRSIVYRTQRSARIWGHWSYGDWYFQNLDLLNDQVDRQKLIDVAKELGRSYDVIFLHSMNNANYNWDSLVYLNKFNVGGKEFMRFTARFIDAIRYHVGRHYLGAQDLASILNGFDTKTPELKAERSEKRLANFSALEDNLIDQLFRQRQAQEPMVKLYEAVREQFGMHKTVVGYADLSDYNETVVDAAHFLGLARLLSDVANLIANFDLDKAIDLNETLFSLRAFKILDHLNRKTFGQASDLIFVKGVHPDKVDSYRQVIQQARDISGKNDVSIVDGRSGWPTYAAQLTALSAKYLAQKNVGAAVAAGSWAAQVETDQGITFSELGAGLLRRAMPVLPITTAVQLALKLQFDRCQDVQQLASYIDRELLMHGVSHEFLVARAYTEIQNRPELLRTPQDVEALIAHEYFWPDHSSPLNTRTALVRGFNQMFRNFNSIEEPLLKQLQNNRIYNPGVWSYDPIKSSALQAQLVARLEALGALPNDYYNLKKFWRRLTDRGVTPTSDKLLHRLIAMVPNDDIESLQRNIVNEHRVWESDLHSRVTIAAVTGSDVYQELLKTPPDTAATHYREYLLTKVVDVLEKLMQERGLTYIQFLEDLSNKILSTYPEAKLIARAKGSALDENNKPSKDQNLEGLRSVFESVRRWPRRDQFNLLLVLRDNAKPTARIKAAFPQIGLERVRRMYEILPVVARVGVLDTFFTLSLVRDDKHSAKWVRQLTEHIVGGQESESQRISLQILTGFLYAINEVGNGNLATTVLSYLYSLPSSATASPGEILKRVLEVFGATGIKLGQFLYASQILPENEARHLQSLQDQARVPTRIELYEDVYDILGLPPGSALPFAILDLLGAASMKYAVRGQDLGNLQRIVLKIFRLDAKNNVDLQFDVLERTAKFLVQNYGERYGVLEVVIDSARQAVRREGSLPNEIRRSQIARKYIYHDQVHSSVRFSCPREALINSRLIIAEYADGVSFNDLPEELKPTIAKALLELEADNMFGNHEVIRFDPDRHAGNFRVYIRPAAEGELEASLQPFAQNNQIDFGQLLRMPSQQRDLIIQIFAIAQIAGKAGANEWAINRLSQTLSLDDIQRGYLEIYLARYLKHSQSNPVTTYVATLAALKRSGFRFENSTYLDFIRGIIQLTPYEKFAPEVKSSTKIFEERVYARVSEELKTFRFDSHQLNLIRLYNGWQKLKIYFNLQAAPFLPTRAEEIELKQFIRRELDCGANLDAA